MEYNAWPQNRTGSEGKLRDLLCVYFLLTVPMPVDHSLEPTTLNWRTLRYDRLLGMFFSGFLLLLMHILLDMLSLGSAKAYTGWGDKLNSRLMAGCVRTNRTKNYQKLSKFDNWFSSYSRKCQGCSSGTQCTYLLTYDARYIQFRDNTKNYRVVA